MTLSFSLTDAKTYHKVLEKKTNELKTLLHLDDQHIFEVNLILDEICTNVFEYNPTIGDLEIEIIIKYNQNNIHIAVIDNGNSFNPTFTVSPDTKLPLEKRKSGGLGIFFVKKYSTHLSYERLNNSNKTVIVKKVH